MREANIHRMREANIHRMHKDMQLSTKAALNFQWL
jgi:hypothetical protein